MQGWLWWALTLLGLDAGDVLPGLMAAEPSLMSREHHFEDGMRGTIAGLVDDAEWLATTPDESVVECSAKCGAAGSRIRRRGAARKRKTRGDHSGHRGFDRFVKWLFPRDAEQDARSTPAEKGHGWLFPREEWAI